jgi:surface protein
MAEMNTTTAELLQQMIDIKKDTRASIESKGVEIVGGMVTYPEAIDEIKQEVTGLAYDFTRAGWLPSNSDAMSQREAQFINDSIDYTAVMWQNYGDYNKWPETYNDGKLCKIHPSGWRKLVVAPNIVNYEKIYPFYNRTYITGGLFSLCSNLRYVPTFDTSNSTKMNNMFALCYSLSFAPYLDTSNVTDMDSMFRYCTCLVDVPLYNTSKVEDMSNMFQYCELLSTIPQFDTSSVTNMRYMFQDCANLFSVPKLNANNLKQALAIFDGCSSLTEFGGFENLKVSLDVDFVTGTRKTKLNKQSMLNIIDGLYDWTTNPQGLNQSEWDESPTITGALRVSLTNEEIAIATNKGWVLR